MSGLWSWCTWDFLGKQLAFFCHGTGSWDRSWDAPPIQRTILLGLGIRPSKPSPCHWHPGVFQHPKKYPRDRWTYQFSRQLLQYLCRDWSTYYNSFLISEILPPRTKLADFSNLPIMRTYMNLYKATRRWENKSFHSKVGPPTKNEGCCSFIDVHFLF